jgi:hypothetical protein
MSTALLPFEQVGISSQSNQKKRRKDRRDNRQDRRQDRRDKRRRRREPSMAAIPYGFRARLALERGGRPL